MALDRLNITDISNTQLDNTSINHSTVSQVGEDLKNQLLLEIETSPTIEKGKDLDVDSFVEKLDIPDDVEDILKKKETVLATKETLLSTLEEKNDKNEVLSDEDINLENFKKPSAKNDKFLPKKKQGRVKGWNDKGLVGGLVFEDVQEPAHDNLVLEGASFIHYLRLKC